MGRITILAGDDWRLAPPFDAAATDRAVVGLDPQRRRVRRCALATGGLLLLCFVLAPLLNGGIGDGTSWATALILGGLALLWSRSMGDRFAVRLAERGRLALETDDADFANLAAGAIDAALAGQDQARHCHIDTRRRTVSWRIDEPAADGR